MVGHECGNSLIRNKPFSSISEPWYFKHFPCDLVLRYQSHQYYTQVIRSCWWLKRQLSRGVEVVCWHRRFGCVALLRCGGMTVEIFRISTVIFSHWGGVVHPGRLCWWTVLTLCDDYFFDYRHNLLPPSVTHHQGLFSLIKQIWFYATIGLLLIVIE